MPSTEVPLTNTVYVANLPFDTTESAVRSHFSTCGGVLDVELAPERRRGRVDTRVTMTSPAYANAAVAQLDHVSFEGRELRVSHSPLRGEVKPSVKIVQQFRERANMAYDIDCAGTPLTVRIFPIDGERWRIEARATDAADAVVMTAIGATRRDALDSALRAWNESASSAIDADAVTRALSEVRAV